MITTIIMLIALIWQFITILNDSYKIGFYEQTLRNNKSKFSENHFKEIEKVMNKKFPIIK